MQWSTPSFPRAKRGTQKKRVVEDAELTAVTRGPLRVVPWPDRWITGAVYDSKGRLLPHSQKLGGLGHQFAMADPRTVAPERRPMRLRGRWLYGGHWMMHFGHFVTETLTTLWPEDLRPVRGLVFHTYRSPDPRVLAWQQRLVDLAGYDGLPIEIVNQRRVRVDELVVPSRSLVQHGWGHPGAPAVWRRIAAAVTDQAPPGEILAWPSRVYLSRSTFNARVRAGGRKDARSSPERDAMLDELFEEAGFALVAPEELAIDDQIRLVRGAGVVAGLSGSALHLAGFSAPGTRVLEVGDQRSPSRGVATQRVINTLCGHLEAFLPARLGRVELVSHLRGLGVWQADPPP